MRCNIPPRLYIDSACMCVHLHTPRVSLTLLSLLLLLSILSLCIKVWEGPLGSASMLGLMADIQGKPYTADVTANPATVEDCQVHETGDAHC